MEQDLKDQIMGKIKQIHQKLGKNIEKSIENARAKIGTQPAQQIIQELQNDFSEQEKKLKIKQERIQRLQKIREQAQEMKKQQNKQQNFNKIKQDLPQQVQKKAPFQEIKQNSKVMQKENGNQIKQIQQQQQNLEEEESCISNTKEIEQVISQNNQIENEEEKENKKPINKFKDRWNSQCRITVISLPTKIQNQPQIKNKKYQIRFTYVSEDGKSREATVRFGSTKGGDFVDNQDNAIREQNYKKYGGLVNPLDGNYWRYWICNTEPDVDHDKATSVIEQTNEIVKLVGEAQECLITHKLKKSGESSLQVQQVQDQDLKLSQKPVSGLQNIVEALRKRNSSEAKQ